MRIMMAFDILIKFCKVPMGGDPSWRANLESSFEKARATRAVESLCGGVDLAK